MTPTKRSILRRVGGAIFLIVLLAGAYLRFSRAAAHYHDPIEDGDALDYYSMGQSLKNESLLSRRPGRAPSAYRAILYPLWISRLPGNSSPGNVRLAAALLGTLCLPLVFILGREVHSGLCGLVAMSFLAFDYRQIDAAASVRIECFYGFLVLCAAISLVEWMRSPDDRNTVRLGLSLGISLLCRSVLFAAPPLLAAWACLRGTRSVRTAVLLLAASYLVLAPWTIRNAYFFGEFVPFERYAAVHNIYTASLGSIRTLQDGDILAVARMSNPGLSSEDGGHTLKNRPLLYAMAIQNIKDHPLRYAASTLERLFVFCRMLVKRIHLVGLGFLLYAIWKLGREPGVAALGLLLAYFLAIHSPMSVTSRYLLPIIGVAFVLVAAGLAAVVESGGDVELGLGRELLPLPEGMWLGAQVLAISLLVLSAFAISSEIGAHPGRPSMDLDVSRPLEAARGSIEG